MEGNIRPAQMRDSFLQQGYLDDQFIQLEDLQDEANPNFVQEVVISFYNDSARLIHNIEHTLAAYPVDFNKLDEYMHHFKGSSSSIGAKKVTDECWRFREYCRERDVEGCMKSFNQVKLEYMTLKRMLDAYFQLRQH